MFFREQPRSLEPHRRQLLGRFLVHAGDAEKIEFAPQDIIPCLMMDNLIDSSDARGLIQGHIVHPAAAGTPDVRMIVHVGVKTSLARTQVKSAYVSLRGEVFEIAVHCSKADVREPLADHLVHIVCGGMGHLLSSS